MTRAPESAEVMKKIAMRIRAPIVSTIVPGRCWNSWKSAPCRSTLPAASVIEPGVSISSLSAEPPSTANHRMPRRVGTISTPMTNWRTVRPRLTRAMKMPTKGAHEIHQPQ